MEGHVKAQTRNTVLVLLCMFYTLSSASNASAQTRSPLVVRDTSPRVQSTQHYEISLEERFSRLEHPWSIAWYKDAERPEKDAERPEKDARRPEKEIILVSERNGNLWLFADARAKKITGLPQDVYKRGQGGWFDIVVGSDLRVYLSYAKGNSRSNGTAVISFVLDRSTIGDASKSIEAKEVKLHYQMNKPVASTLHFGGSMSMGRDARGAEVLYLALGERGQRYEAQKIDSDHGTVVAIPLDFSSPYRIVSFGHRNPQGLYYDQQRDILYETEHGPMGGDEFNRIKIDKNNRANYGWPVVSYGKEYGSGAAIGEGGSKEGIEEPLHYWPVSPALSGLTSYYGDLFPKWNGNLFASALKLQQLYRIVLDDSGARVLEVEALLKEKVGRIRSVKLGPRGALYIVTDQANGKVFKITRN